MKALKFTNKEIMYIKKIIKWHDKIYGDEETIWSFDDVEVMRNLGFELINLIDAKLTVLKNAEIILKKSGKIPEIN